MTELESSQHADAEPHPRMECGVCWTVYDPAEGDALGRVVPGTPFAALPEDWRCPTCDAPRSQFLRLDDAS
jgi:rubredoxin